MKEIFLFLSLIISILPGIGQVYGGEDNLKSSVNLIENSCALTLQQAPQELIRLHLPLYSLLYPVAVVENRYFRCRTDSFPAAVKLVAESFSMSFFASLVPQQKTEKETWNYKIIQEYFPEILTLGFDLDKMKEIIKPKLKQKAITLLSETNFIESLFENFDKNSQHESFHRFKEEFPLGNGTISILGMITSRLYAFDYELREPFANFQRCLLPKSGGVTFLSVPNFTQKCDTTEEGNPSGFVTLYDLFITVLNAADAMKKSGQYENNEFFLKNYNLLDQDLRERYLRRTGFYKIEKLEKILSSNKISLRQLKRVTNFTGHDTVVRNKELRSSFDKTKTVEDFQKIFMEAAYDEKEQIQKPQGTHWDITHSEDLGKDQKFNPKLFFSQVKSYLKKEINNTDDATNQETDD